MKIPNRPGFEMKQPGVTRTFRLDPSVLAEIKRRCGVSYSVNSNTTPLEAGVQIGMARVLELLSNDLTVTAPTDRE